MATIIIQNLATKLPAQAGQTVLQAAATNHQDWMQACGGKGKCTTCKMQILKGGELLAGLTEAEERMRTAGRLPGDCRLACQSQLVNDGELEVRIPESSHLPHLTYVD